MLHEVLLVPHNSGPVVQGLAARSPVLEARSDLQEAHQAMLVPHNSGLVAQGLAEPSPVLEARSALLGAHQVVERSAVRVGGPRRAVRWAPVPALAALPAAPSRGPGLALQEAAAPEASPWSLASARTPRQASFFSQW